MEAQEVSIFIVFSFFLSYSMFILIDVVLLFDSVGKTWLAKTLAAQYYGSEKDMIRIDMSE